MENHIRNTIDELDYLYDADDIYEAIENAYSEGELGKFEADFLVTLLELKSFNLQGSELFETLFYHILNL